MHRVYRCEFRRVAPQLSPWPIVTVLYVLSPSPADTERLAEVVFEQCYSLAARKAGFAFHRSWDVGVS